MNPEILTVLIIILITGLLVTLAVAVGLRWTLGQRWKNKERSLSRIEKCLLLCGLSIVICFLYSLLVEPYWLDVTHITLHSTKLPAGSRGFRIAQISDLHSDPQVRLEEKLPDIIAAEKPDLIVFTGDCINEPAGLPIFKKFLQETSLIAPTFVVRGNWDAWYWSQLNPFGSSKAIELNGNVREIVVGDTQINITGFSVSPERDPAPFGGDAALLKAFNDVTSKKQFSIVLYHYPDLIEDATKHNVDLYFAGHTHGGQVRIPFYGALITLSKFGKKYEAGLYHVQNTALYVNRGIGMEGRIAPRIRFLCRPELTIVDIKPIAAQ